MVTVFDGDDGGYHAWLAANPHGYVVNTGRGMSSSYMVLHRASCLTIGEYNETAREGGFTERAYIKVCSESIPDLRDWVRQHGRADGSFSSECGRCNP
jgi:hypothetical protein